METLFIQYLNTLEGYKTAIKNLHWSSKNLNTHKQLDKLLKEVSDYQDSIAEEYMGIGYEISTNLIYGIKILADNSEAMLFDLKTEVESFYLNLGLDTTYIGIKSETENFIHLINKYAYLLGICEDKYIE